MRVRWRAMADRRGAIRTHHASALDRDAHGDSPALPSPCCRHRIRPSRRQAQRASGSGRCGPDATRHARQHGGAASPWTIARRGLCRTRRNATMRGG